MVSTMWAFFLSVYFNREYIKNLNKRKIYRVEVANVRLFADDSIIYRDIKTQDDCLKLQQDLDSAARWEADWLMAFHPDKCTKLTVAQKKQSSIIIFSTTTS